MRVFLLSFCAVALKSERRYLAAATVLTDYAEVVCVSVSVCLCVRVCV